MLAGFAFLENELIARFALPGFEGPARQVRVIFIAAGGDGRTGAVVHPPRPDVGGLESGGENQDQENRSQRHGGIVAQSYNRLHVFRKVLIANRGEIALRVIRTLREMGIISVAVYSDADRAALHVRKADEAAHIGAAASRESYLNIERILDAAKRHGVDAIHPGYGFLSENAEFAAACTAAGFVFIGPPASAIAAMGSKTSARRIARDGGAPVVPGTEEGQVDAVAAFAAKAGYPVMLKAVAGGGGKGMRRVDRAGGSGGKFRIGFERSAAGVWRRAHLCGEAG